MTTHLPRRASEAAPRFSDRTLSFLRALRRNNDRDWFRARRDVYAAVVRAPMIALIERLEPDLRRIAPELVVSPRVSLYRVYRDTRFSEDKSPLKTNVAAIFPCRGMAKHEGAGLYMEIDPDRVLLAGGLYAPGPRQLQLIREHIAHNLTSLRSLVESPTFRRTFGQLDGQRLKRVPRGFRADHPAAEYLKFRQFLAGRERPVALATSPRFYQSVVSTFEQLAPLVRFLNTPLVGRGGPEL